MEHYQNLIPKSNTTTLGNKTGFWRFMRPSYDEKTAPCSIGCPVGEDISMIAMLAGRGQFQEAFETILNENPFPAVCGRVCFHPCEKACNREQFDQAVAIQQLERFIGDTALFQNVITTNAQNTTGKKIAIIGAGPAGLSAAWFLNRLGYLCEVFETRSAPGGLLRWGIPDYRLPLEILEKEINRITTAGVKIHCNTPAKPADKTDRFDALVQVCGNSQPLVLKIPGAQMALDGLALLEKIRQGGQIKPGRAAVIGGGNTAVDIARSLLRFGVETTIVYRRLRKDMPGFEHEITMGLEEGLKLKELRNPLKIKTLKSDLLELSLQFMQPDGLDANGRTQVVSKDVFETMTVEYVITAMGAGPDKSALQGSDADQILNLSHTIFKNGERPLVWGGDLTNTNKTVTDAIASGKQAAMALDVFFKKGFDNIRKQLETCQVGNGQGLSMAIYQQGPRAGRSQEVVNFESLNTAYFATSLRETSGTLSPAQALEVALRCFNCGVCNDCDLCLLFCPEMAICKSGSRTINLDYCKGCGICMSECPGNVISLEEENS